MRQSRRTFLESAGDDRTADWLAEQIRSAGLGPGAVTFDFVGRGWRAMLDVIAGLLRA